MRDALPGEAQAAGEGSFFGSTQLPATDRTQPSLSEAMTSSSFPSGGARPKDYPHRFKPIPEAVASDHDPETPLKKP